MSLELCAQDRNTFCPACGERHSDYSVVPEHTRNWSDDEGQHVTHMPEQRDYRCRNCDHEWSMGEVES